MSRSLPSHISILLLLALAGCSKEPGPEQKQADAEYAQAKAALAGAQFSSARSALLTAISLDEHLGRTSLVAEEARQLGALYAEAALFDSAFLFYDRSLEQFKALADRGAAREVTLDVAALHRRMGEERKAYALYSEALRFAGVFNEEEGKRQIARAMLPSCRALDDVAEAQKLEADLLKTATTSGDVNRQARAYVEMAYTALKKSETGTAEQSFSTALTLADQSHDSLLAATIVAQLAMLSHESNQNSLAFERYTDALKRVEKLRGGDELRLDMLARIGNIYLASRQPAEAARFYRAALTAAMNSGNSLAEGYMFIQLGQCEADREKETANYRSALELFKGVRYAPGMAYALRCLGLASQRANQPSEAIAYFKEAIARAEESLSVRDSHDLYEECEQSTAGGQRETVYGDMIELLLQLNRVQEAFWYVDRRNNERIFHALTALEPRTADGDVNIAIAEYLRARAVRVGAERQLARILEDARRQKEFIAPVQEVLQRAGQSTAECASLVAQKARALEPAVMRGSTDLGALQRNLPTGTALVQYAATRRAFYAFVVTRGKVTVELAAVEREQLKATCQEFFTMLRSREAISDSLKGSAPASERGTDAVGAQLFDAFVRPIERDLEGMTDILVVLPDGFTPVPVHALRRNMRGAPYVAERFSVRYLPMAGAVLLAQDKSAPVINVMALGYAGSTGWDVEYELRDIRAFFKEARLSFESGATFATLQNEHADLAVIAGEFHFSSTAPGNSYAVLSDGKNPASPRNIPMGEFFSLPGFPTVVISNLTPSLAGTDPAMPYIFMASGSSVVVTNGYAPSRKTRKFFGEQFYTALLAGSPTRAAFRSAQIQMIKAPGYSAPHVWAPFFEWGR